MLKYFFFSICLGLTITCSYAQNKMTESSGHKPTLTTTASQSISLADQVKHLEMRLEKLKSRQPAATKEELQKVEMYLTEKRKALAAEQTMIEKRKTRQK